MAEQGTGANRRTVLAPARLTPRRFSFGGSWADLRVASDMTTERERILLVVTPSVSDEQLEHEIAEARLADADVQLVVPSIAKSAFSYWFSDEGALTQARAAAEAMQKRILTKTGSLKADAGDCDPSLAVQDAIARFRPDRIIVVHRRDHPGYREDRLDADRLEKRINRDVEEHLVAA